MHGYYNSLIRKKYVSYGSLLDCNVYHTRDIENFGTYVSVKYQLNDLIVQHIDGCNPLAIKAILKEVNQVTFYSFSYSSDFLIKWFFIL